MPNLNSRLKLRRDTILFSPDRTSRCPQISPQGTPHPLAPSPPEGRGGGSFIVPVGSASQTGPPGARKEPLTPWPPLPRRGEGGFPSFSRSALRGRPGHPARGKNPSPPGPLSPGGARGDFLHCPGRLCESDRGTRHSERAPHPLAPSPPEGRGGISFIVPVGSASQTGAPGTRNPSPPGPLSPGGARGRFLHCPGRHFESDRGTRGSSSRSVLCTIEARCLQRASWRRPTRILLV